MNTVGKILVILNFLFAVVVGLLLVVDIALRNKWKEAHESVIREVTVLKAGLEVNKRAAANVLKEYQDRELEIEKLKQKIKDTADTLTVKEAEFDIRRAEVENMLKDKELIVKEAQGGQKRLKEEVDLLSANIKDRETSIVALQASIKELRTTAVQYQALAQTRQIQNENLLEQVRALSQDIARRESGAVTTDVMVIRNPNEPNPPAVQVNGKVEKVEADLVQLTLGTDHGVAKNHTLDVYRMLPEAKYLGMVRIVEANTHQSVGRLIPSGNAAFRTPLRVGDLVTSKLTK